MWHGKNRAITFSFDDGVKQDIRAIEILNKYGLKATFNLNSGYLGTKNTLVRNDIRVCHDKVSAKDVKVLGASDVKIEEKEHVQEEPQKTNDEYEISEDGMKYTFTLREGICFHNGEKVTAADVEYSIKRARLYLLKF